MEPTVMGRKLKAMIWNKRKKINIHPDQNEETRIQKNEETFEPLGQLETFQYLNYRGARRRRGRT